MQLVYQFMFYILVQSAKMRRLVITLITIVITDFTNAQYPGCVGCSDGK